MSEKQQYPIVYLEWEDAYLIHGTWDFIHEVKSAVLASVSTVGYIINETDDALVVSGSISDVMCLHSIVIPKRWIKKRVPIVLSGHVKEVSDGDNTDPH